MLILELKKGLVCLDFQCEIPGELVSTLWTDGTLLYVTEESSNQLLVYRLDGQLIKTYTLPAHPRLKHGSKFLSHKGVNYVGLIGGSQLLAGVEGGLLTWTAADVLSGKELEIEEKPAMGIITVAEGDGKESYYVTVPCKNIDDIIRFGEVTARKIAALRGKQFYDNADTRNKKFGGKIILLIESISEKNKPYLDRLAKRSTYFCEVMDITSSDGKKYPHLWYKLRYNWIFNECRARYEFA
jgi:hypothetical protein